MMTGEGETAIRVVIRGRVQGVGFRAWTAGQAELHGLAGWVRNRCDGSVEAVFRGPNTAVEIMLKTCREGPHGAGIEQVEEYPADPEDIASVTSTFTIRQTG